MISLLLSACSFNWDNKEELFQKKQECLKYRNEVIKIFEGQSSWKFLDEIFYNPELNTCLYSFKTNTEIGVYDYLANKTLFSTSDLSTCLEIYKNNDENLKICDKAYNNVLEKIKELKWE